MAVATGGELLAQALARAGVEVVFALHGGHLNPLLLGCAKEGIRLVDGRHEAAVGNSADGYARATGGLAVAAVTAGAGFANVLPAIVSAHVDRVPILFITSSPPLRESETNELQGGVDQVGIVRSITRWAHRVTSTARIPDLAGLAIRWAQSSPPGPVLLDVPVDVMHLSADDEAANRSAALTFRPAFAPNRADVTQAVELLRSAERPVVVAGSGVRWAGAFADLARFAETTGIPVFSQVNTVGLPADHPLNGYGAWHLAKIGEVAGQRPDLVCLIGARLGRYLGGRSGSMVPDSAAVIQVDVDPAEIGRVRRVELPIVADAGETLRAISAAVAEGDGMWPDWSGWARDAVSVKDVPSAFADEPVAVDGRMHPYHAVREALLAVGPGATVVVDGGEAAGWAWENLAVARPKDVLGFAGYLGILGLATGQALGAQVARPGERVVMICGDGAAGFHIQEFDTMLRHRLPVVALVVNNALWAQSARSQGREYGPEGEIISHLVDTDYDRVAAGFGAFGERVTRVEDVAGAVKRGLESGLPSLINLAVAYGPEPRTAAGMGKARIAGQVSLPYYESVPEGSN